MDKEDVIEALRAVIQIVDKNKESVDIEFTKLPMTNHLLLNVEINMNSDINSSIINQIYHDS